MKLKNILVTIIALGTIFLFTGCKKIEVSKQNPQNVKVITVTKSDIEVQDEYAGEITSADESGVVPKIGGKVTSVLVDVGERVNEGDLLFVIDSSDLLAQLNQAQTGVELAKVNLSRTTGSSFSQSLIQTQSAVEQAQINYNDAKSNYDRTKSLYNTGSTAKRELDSAETRMKSSLDQLNAAKKNYELLQTGVKPDSEQGGQKQLEQAEASVQLIQSQINNTKVLAPISGVVSKRNINVGEGVSMGAPAIVIANTDNLFAEVDIPEKLVSKLNKGVKIGVTVDNKMVDGFIDSISPVADPKTHNYTVKIKLIGKDKNIKPGMFAKIKVVVDKKSKVISVPNQSIMSDNGIQYVFLVADGKVVKRNVKIGVSNDRYSETIEGLIEGDSMIFEGQNFLSNGQKVNIVK